MEEELNQLPDIESAIVSHDELVPNFDGDQQSVMTS
jgi:hypothetical protein